MEKRLGKISISAAGGTAGKGAKTYKLTVPSAWIAALGITADEREVEMSFDGERIIISRPMDPARFRNPDHEQRTFLYYDGDALCTRIFADFTDHTVYAENCTDNPVKTAFGKNALPTWDDFTAFLEERCVPRQRAGLREYLEALGLDEYDPLAIVEKTQGRMAEDNQWIEVIDG